MKNRILTLTLLGLLTQACNSSDKNTTTAAKDSASVQNDTTGTNTAAADSLTIAQPAGAATILARKQVPVLCYHHIREYKPTDRSGKPYIVPPAVFRDQIKFLADSGYQTISPDQYYNYLATGAPLPEKPVMITFDDTDKEQHYIGAKELEKYGFKGVFFLMTIVINRPNYMTKEEIKDLADRGHTIGAHTWDHHMVTKYTEEDWNKQLTESKAKIESITGKRVDHFAYPFGLWNKPAIPELKERGIKSAYQLATARDSTDPLYTIRRIIVPGSWNGQQLGKAIRSSFKG